jgi:hypothetical protein
VTTRAGETMVWFFGVVACVTVFPLDALVGVFCMEQEKEKNIIGIRRYLIFKHQINYSAVHKIMIAIFAAPHYAELYTIIGRSNVFSYNDLRSSTEILVW